MERRQSTLRNRDREARPTINTAIRAGCSVDILQLSQSLNSRAPGLVRRLFVSPPLRPPHEHGKAKHELRERMSLSDSLSLRRSDLRTPGLLRSNLRSFGRRRHGHERPLKYRRTIEYVVDTICHIIDTDDAQEGLEAFVEKRQPDWS